MKLLIILCLLVSYAFAAEVNLEKSNLKWHGTKVTGKHFGSVPFQSASVELKDGKLVTGTFVADLKNYTIEDISGEWATKFLTHTKGPDFFEVEKYPTATLVIKSIDKKSVATADLTIKNKTNEVKFKINEKKGVYSGVLEFDRTKFDMIYGSKDFFKSIGDKAIHNEVKVDFEFVLK